MRYALYALAWELKQPNVDAMLQALTAMQIQEWLAFLKIREELRNADARQNDPKQLAGSLSRALDGYQHIREKHRIQ